MIATARDAMPIKIPSLLSVTGGSVEYLDSIVAVSFFNDLPSLLKKFFFSGMITPTFFDDSRFYEIRLCRG